MLQTGESERSTTRRTAAVSVLGLLRDDPLAEELAQRALKDKNSFVRAAAATAIGKMGSKASIPLLRQALADKDSRVLFAAANSLLSLGDTAGYDFYYDVLTGERKSGEGLISEHVKMMKDTKKMARLGFETGIGFVPYAGAAWTIIEIMSKDYVSPVRVDALKHLANDSDSRIEKALVTAASDKHWTVRVAALDAIARHGEQSLIPAVMPHVTDKKADVRYTAAAAVIRLSATTEAAKVP